ncbi:MAG: glycosyl hydrolase 53 family protein [Anaerolineales bacterium]
MLAIRLSFVLSILVLAVLLGACGQTTTISTLPAVQPSDMPTVEGVIKGYGISPLGFPADYSRFPDFLAEVGSLPNGGVMFNGAWRQDVSGGADAGQIPQTAIGLVLEAGNYGYTPIIVFGWRSEDSLQIGVPTNPTNDWTNEEAKALFKQMLADFAAGYHPPFIFLGNESDAYFISNPEDYSRWVSFYNEAYDAIKAVSPETMVGPVFQYERLSGQGAFNQWTTPQWGALEDHNLEKVDIVGLTLYPWLGVATPEEVPDGYFAPLAQRIGDKPVAITETGWPGDGLGLQTAWEASPEAQIRYIDTLRRILPDINVKILNWLHLNQMVQTPENATFWQVFSSISLRDFEGNKRPVYEAWIEFQP